jgi:hypothetical protein
MTTARQRIAVIITFRNSNKNWLERRAVACRSSMKEDTLYNQAQKGRLKSKTDKTYKKYDMNLTLFVIKRHALKAYGAVDLELHAF